MWTKLFLFVFLFQIGLKENFLVQPIKLLSKMHVKITCVLDGWQFNRLDLNNLFYFSLEENYIQISIVKATLSSLHNLPFFSISYVAYKSVFILCLSCHIWWLSAEVHQVGGFLHFFYFFLFFCFFGSVLRATWYMVHH